MEKRLTMLVVDDIEVNRVSLRETFLDVYDVIEACDGVEALEKMRTQKTDIVILDLFMPNMSGFDVITEMKRDEALSDIPIIVKTAIDEKTEVKVLEMGADDFIFSPYDPAIIKNRVKNIVQKYILERERMMLQIEEEKRMNQAKEAFLARMSHELRTPINGILGIAQLSKYYQKDTVQVQEAFRKVKGQAEYLLALVNDILDMAAIDNEKLVIHTSVFQLNSIVSAISDLYFSACRQKGVNFHFEVSEIFCEYLVGDPIRIKQILINLLNNALKFTEEGGSIDVYLKEKQLDAHKVELIMSVTDTGCGIGDKAIDKVWMPFEQEEHADGKNYGGSGLGLSITKSIVECMQGSISVSSEVGKGTSFEVRLPLEKGKECPGEKRKFSSMRAFILDNDEIAMNYQSAILFRLGIKYDTSNDGEEAIKMMQDAYKNGRGYDICFINWQMADAYGKKMVKRIRQIFNQDTIIITVSSYNVLEEEDEMKKAGVDYIIAKPILQSKIYNLMTEICKMPEKINNNPSLSYDFSGKRLLVAEDNAINAEVLTCFLQAVNFEVECVKNGKEALERFISNEGKPYSAVLLDVNMPIMDGYEAARMIRGSELPTVRPVPIIAVTANAFSEDIIKAHEAGMNAHIAKPIDTNILYHTLEEYI